VISSWQKPAVPLGPAIELAALAIPQHFGQLP
jgi:hypothetical protein